MGFFLLALLTHLLFIAQSLAIAENLKIMIANPILQCATALWVQIFIYTQSYEWVWQKR